MATFTLWEKALAHTAEVFYLKRSTDDQRRAVRTGSRSRPVFWDWVGGESLIRQSF